MYKKQLYVFHDDRPIPALIRNYEEKDIDALIRIQQESFPPPFPSELWWNKEQLMNHMTLFPEGALCVEIDGEVVGSMTSLIVNYHPNDVDHTWEEITDNGYIRNHNRNGNTLYVVDIGVRPAYRKLGLGKWLMQSMYEVVVHQKLERLLGGSRMPGYHRYANEMTAEQYVDAVIKGKLTDPVITFLLRCGRTPVKVVANYLEDAQSCNYALLMEWRNPFL
ncbi:acetyltransferase [Anoxybacillus gonensis]|uniref:GNAT family N-acetyltransferase n=1 Tax=Anoxybacillus gonensis TaxID=198467 RepID=A0AAW7TJY6_9BACL|nr:MULTISPECIES: GNAT family N-acetyltransferase [Anoxybacillus]AXM90254.1 N-acetyltransferase [Anoxybacillus ayderensis G10]THD17564.1 N-acetyltransferase [Anoxybacillus ayderensis]AKS38483.1 acetyltransferase [Anoxybacillus gonensis]EMI11141.1 acetyltransferase [Anoxybacillus gonensis]KGP59741.1 acetyltransferase [Anoxybacillus gonensis]